MNIYFAYDKVSEQVFTVFAAKNDGEAVRNNFVGFTRVLPRQDIELYCIGSFDAFQSDSTSFIGLTSIPRLVDIENAYHFPEQVVKNMSVSRDHDLQVMQKVSGDVVDRQEIRNSAEMASSVRDLTDLSE